MSHTMMIEVPDEVYEALRESPALGDTPEEAAVTVLTRHAQRPRGNGSQRDPEAMARLLRFAGCMSSGNPNAADNEQIDADLARESGRGL